LSEEIWFFLYHLHVSEDEFMTIPINRRKWMIDRFIQQKERENQAMEAARRKASKGKK